MSLPINYELAISVYFWNLDWDLIIILFPLSDSYILKISNFIPYLPQKSVFYYFYFYNNYK